MEGILCETSVSLTNRLLMLIFMSRFQATGAHFCSREVIQDQWELQHLPSQNCSSKKFMLIWIRFSLRCSSPSQRINRGGFRYQIYMLLRWLWTLKRSKEKGNTGREIKMAHGTLPTSMRGGNKACVDSISVLSFLLLIIWVCNKPPQKLGRVMGK